MKEEAGEARFLFPSVMSGRGAVRQLVSGAMLRISKSVSVVR